MYSLKFRGLGMLLGIMAILPFWVYPPGSVYGAERIGLKGAPGMGLTVEPGGITLQNIPPGKKVDIFKVSGISLVIYNRSDSYHTYRLKAGRPEDTGITGWLKGYSPIPDGSWFTLEKDVVRIPPQAKAYVNMFINIPDEDKYYNQKWVVGLSIEGVPEPGEKLALAAHPSYYIETLGKEDVSESPDGKLGIVPGVKTLEGVSVGTNKRLVKITVYNNDTGSHTYKVYSRLPRKKSGDRIIVSPGFQWVKDKRWLRPSSKRVSIKGGGKKEVYVSLVIPRRKEYEGKKFEGLVFVEDEKGDANFCRVRFTVKK